MKIRSAILIPAAALSLSLSLYAQMDRVPAGTTITVRTNESIDGRSPSDSRIYTGVVDRDVLDNGGRVVIPRGSDAELILRNADRNSVALDLESVTVNGRRYAVDVPPETITGNGLGKQGVGANQRTAKYVGGGALIGSIIGAIAGGGKGAAIGAATGAGAGAVGQTVTRGSSVRVPSESLITFRLDSPLAVSAADTGYMRDGHHYHRYDSERSRTPDYDRQYR